MSFDAENIKRKTENNLARQERERQERKRAEEIERITHEQARVACENTISSAEVQELFRECQEEIERAAANGCFTCVFPNSDYRWVVGGKGEMVENIEDLVKKTRSRYSQAERLKVIRLLREARFKVSLESEYDSGVLKRYEGQGEWSSGEPSSYDYKIMISWGVTKHGGNTESSSESLGAAFLGFVKSIFGYALVFLFLVMLVISPPWAMLALLLILVLCS